MTRAQKRAQLITAFRVAGYHNDRQACMRLYVENNISMANSRKAWEEGKKLREGGVRCDCAVCEEERMLFYSRLA